jgi:hypothetical protein
MEIVGKNHDKLAASSDDYNGGAETAALTFLAIVIGRERWYMNSSATTEWNPEDDGLTIPPPG